MKNGVVAGEDSVARWASAPPGPAPELCDDATFVRRAHLDVVGIIPTADEARTFCEDAAPDKRTIRLILTSRAYPLRYQPALEDAFDVEKPASPRWFSPPRSAVSPPNSFSTASAPPARAIQRRAGRATATIRRR